MFDAVQDGMKQFPNGPRITVCLRMESWLDFLQWPAMLTTVIAAWLVASQRKLRRRVGFVFLAGNVLWVIWSWHDSAWARVVLQFCLAALNIRGVNKND